VIGSEDVLLGIKNKASVSTEQGSEKVELRRSVRGRKNSLGASRGKAASKSDAGRGSAVSKREEGGGETDAKERRTLPNLNGRQAEGQRRSQKEREPPPDRVVTS